MISFWGWLYLLAEKNYRREYLKQNHNDFKCPKCNVWRSISSIKNKIDPVSVENGIWVIQCGQCSKQDYWNFNIAPVAMRCDKHGSPSQ